MSATHPNLFVVGAMKAGTTALHGYLDRHPEIFMSEPKEPGHFALSEPTDKKREAYLALFTSGAGAKWRGESSTQYTKAPAITGVPERLARFAPDARILYMVREPAARIVSQYLFKIRIHGERRSLCDAVRADPSYREIGDYAGQIAPYVENFGPDRVLVLSAERLNADRQAVMDQVFAWLELEPVDMARELRKNTAADGVRRHRRLTTWALRTELEPLRRLVKRAGAEGLARRAWARFNPPAPAPVTPDEVAQLRAMLADETARQQAALAPLMGALAPDWVGRDG